MNKKLVYVGLLLPLGCACQEQSEQDALQVENAGVNTSPLDTWTPEGVQDHDEQDTDTDSADDTDDADDALENNDLDLTASPEYARGNWYEKQQALKQAHDVYQEVRQKEVGVAHFENLFITKKNELTNTFEEFSQSLTLSLATLYQRITQELEKIDVTAKPGMQLTQDERIKLTEIQETKNHLAQLKNDLDTITELYKAADQAMAVLMQQITATHNFEQKAFDAYEKIAQVLSDQVAKQLYAEIVAARENINGIADYIKGDFSRYFDELSENITKSITLVHQELATLKERGVDLTQPEQEDLPQEKEPTAAPIKQSSSYFGAFFAHVYNFMAGIVHWIKGFFA